MASEPLIGMRGVIKLKLLGFTDYGIGDLSRDPVETIFDLEANGIRTIQAHGTGILLDTSRQRTYYAADSLDSVYRQIMAQRGGNHA